MKIASEALNTTGMDEEIIRTVKRAERLEIEVFGRLFNTHSHLLHSTISLLRAVFYKSENYNGSNPKILVNSVIQKYT